MTLYDQYIYWLFGGCLLHGFLTAVVTDTSSHVSDDFTFLDLDKPLGLALRDSLNYINWGGKSQAHCGGAPFPGLDMD